MISLIVAASDNNVIGSKGELPWRLSSDLKRFKTLTMGKPIVMGRLTYESIGRALPGRQNIVITRQADYEADGCDVVCSIEAAFEAAGDAEEIVVIGGGDVYRQCLPIAERIYMTRVHTEIEGDAFFPPLDDADWQQTSADVCEVDDKDDYPFTFITYDRPVER